MAAGLLFLYYIDNLDDMTNTEYITPAIKNAIKTLGDTYFKTAYNYYSGESTSILDFNDEAGLSMAYITPVLQMTARTYKGQYYGDTLEKVQAFVADI